MKFGALASTGALKSFVTVTVATPNEPTFGVSKHVAVLGVGFGGNLRAQRVRVHNAWVTASIRGRASRT
jgi:hypothetical protein